MLMNNRPCALWIRAQSGESSVPPPKRTCVSRVRSGLVLDVASIEKDGMCGTVLRDTIAWSIAVPAIAQWLATQPRWVHPAAERYFAHCTYSLFAVGQGVAPSDDSVAIAVGEDTREITDVAAYRRLWEICTNAALSPKERIMWLMVAHTLVRPHVVNKLADMVHRQRESPKPQSVEELGQRLVAQLGVPGRTWTGSLDCFAMGQVNSRAHTYCGTVVLRRLLNSWSGVEALAEVLAVFVCSPLSTPFSHVCGVIAAAKLPGLSGLKQYWTIHLARTLTPSFTGFGVVSGVSYDEDGVQYLISMGEGSRAGELLNIYGKNAWEQMPLLCKALQALARRLGRDLDVDAGAVVCSFCESHRRNGLVRGSTGPIWRRASL